MKSHQKTNARPQKNTNSYSPVTTTSKSGPPLPSPCRLDGRVVRRPVLDIRRRPTSRWTCTPKTQPSSVENPTAQSNKKSKKKEVRFTLESVCARGTSSGSGGLL